MEVSSIIIILLYQFKFFFFFFVTFLGWLYDITLSYSPAFILAGIMIALSGLVMFAVPPIQRMQARKAEHENAQDMALS